MCTFGLSGCRVKPRLRAPTLRGSHAAGPNPWGPNFFCFWAPPLWAPDPSGPHSSGRGPPGLHIFCVWAPTFLIFFKLLICSFVCAFLIVSISCIFFENFTVFVFVGFFSKRTFLYFTFFRVGEEGRRGKPKPQTSFQFGRRGLLPLLPPSPPQN